MTHPFDLSGRTALITGASRGLGFEMAKALGEAGATVILNGRSNKALKISCEKLQALNITTIALAFDVTDVDAMDNAFSQIPQLDILVNNVGSRDRRTIDDFELDEVRDLFNTNLVAPFDLARRSAKLMDCNGRIINITSIAGDIARAGDAIYTASKAGLTGLTKALAAEFGPKGITVNAIAPGFFATEANQEMVHDEAILSFLEKRTSIGRWGQPQEIGGACVFLASSAASYITGQIITVDGGMTSHF